MITGNSEAFYHLRELCISMHPPLNSALRDTKCVFSTIWYSKVNTFHETSSDTDMPLTTHFSKWLPLIIQFSFHFHRQQIASSEKTEESWKSASKIHYNKICSLWRVALYIPCCIPSNVAYNTAIFHVSHLRTPDVLIFIENCFSSHCDYCLLTLTF